MFRPPASTRARFGSTTSRHRAAPSPRSLPSRARHRRVPRKAAQRRTRFLLRFSRSGGVLRRWSAASPPVGVDPVGHSDGAGLSRPVRSAPYVLGTAGRAPASRLRIARCAAPPPRRPIGRVHPAFERGSRRVSRSAHGSAPLRGASRSPPVTSGRPLEPKRQVEGGIGSTGQGTIAGPATGRPAAAPRSRARGSGTPPTPPEARASGRMPGRAPRAGPVRPPPSRVPTGPARATAPIGAPAAGHALVPARKALVRPSWPATREPAIQRTRSARLGGAPARHRRPDSGPPHRGLTS